MFYFLCFKFINFFKIKPEKFVILFLCAIIYALFIYFFKKLQCDKENIKILKVVNCVYKIKQTAVSHNMDISFMFETRQLLNELISLFGILEIFIRKFCFLDLFCLPTNFLINFILRF